MNGIRMRSFHYLMIILMMTAIGCGNTEKAENAEPDNTAVNARDRGGEPVTPMDQSNNEADLAVTQSIRQAIVANDSLSIAAKNIKIITTVGGLVTLRGPVMNESERAQIEATAKQVAGVTQVNNQLEVASGGY